MALGTFLSAHGDAMLYGAIVTAVPSWIVSNIVLKPISIVREKRMKALQVGDRFSAVSSRAPEDRVRIVRYELNDVRLSCEF